MLGVLVHIVNRFLEPPQIIKRDLTHEKKMLPLAYMDDQATGPKSANTMRAGTELGRSDTRQRLVVTGVPAGNPSIRISTSPIVPGNFTG